MAARCATLLAAERKDGAARSGVDAKKPFALISSILSSAQHARVF